MIEFLMQPWPWWFSGILIGLTVPLLFVLAGKAFGISTSLQQAGAMCAPCNLDYLKNHKWRSGIWTLVLAGGIALGGFIAVRFLSSEPIEFLPESFYSVGGAVRLLIGGGAWIALFTLAGAIGGMFLYAWLKPRLPH